MERFTQFRDRGTGVAPFFPPPPPPLGFPKLIVWVTLFWFRLFIFIPICLAYFMVFHWLPLPSLVRKGFLWLILAVPSFWWIDLQVDGVRKGTLGSTQHQNRLPGPGSVIASSFTSPIDPFYLAAVFNPVFVACYPYTGEVEHLSLWQAILRAFADPQPTPKPNARMVSLFSIIQKYPNRSIALFPECTTTNGQGVLPLSPALLSAPHRTKIFPVTLRHDPKELMTPVPGTYFTWLWRLLGRPSHFIRVRIGQAVVGVTAEDLPVVEPHGDAPGGMNGNDGQPFREDHVLVLQEQVPNHVADSLARLGRARRVALDVREKEEFVKLYRKYNWTW
ncbi:lysophosphatidic acid acyltransferase LOA1 [Aspergillus ibericus CBS 121593]|uniref:Vacuolar protein sorting protein Vps66 n=1 Tax=Aspergillus ibericus CBS 121593 TaxID=1448316 RepID=A0A395GL37_9EURO|nr:vacuolar protein sorting protein Vps66 [Aspergillus ibericus CBS 121593]RAK96225.1 vacuolar protein sorting protein Vps66 [Aspergillus ibericus CBS 121593]